ncbi:Heat shock transcription factor [Coemansia sp. Benny D115]|nr:Heat shock transcription factor [Coemansia sp. Benny D115]
MQRRLSEEKRRSPAVVRPHVCMIISTALEPSTARRSQPDQYAYSIKTMASSFPSASSPNRKQLPGFRTLLPTAAHNPAGGSEPVTSDYRTTIHFLTTPTPSSNSTAAKPRPAFDMDVDADIDTKSSPALSTVPVSRLLSSEESIQGFRTSYQSSASTTPPRLIPGRLPAIQPNPNNIQYRDDELTGMAGLMELASPEKKGYIHSPDSSKYYAYASGPISQLGSVPETYSSNTSSNSTSSHTVPPALNIASRGSPSPYSGHLPYPSSGQQQQHQQQQQQQRPYPNSNPLQPSHYAQQQQQQYLTQQQYHSQQQPQQQTQLPRFGMHHSATAIGSPHSASQTMLTPDSLPSAGMHKPTRSFPATIDDVQTARRRSQSTDSMQNPGFGSGPSALPCVLGNANIRNRSYTQTQRQRTSDTPLFPILLHRIINDPNNESWIRWCDDGKAFKFSSADNLLGCLQAAGLRAQNYHSIEKNLNDYRFVRLTDQRRKIPDADGRLWWMFSHPQFLRSNPDGIVNIQRRRRTNPPAVSPQPSAMPMNPQVPLPHSAHSAHSALSQQQHHMQSQSQYSSLPPADTSSRQGQF